MEKLSSKVLKDIVPPFARGYALKVIVPQEDSASGAAVILLTDGRRYAYFYSSSISGDYHVFNRGWESHHKNKDNLIWFNTAGALLADVRRMYDDMHLGSNLEKPFYTKCRRLLT